jgi:hypothetical protein
MPFLLFLSFCELPLGAIVITINSLLNKTKLIRAQSLQESSFHNQNTANNVNKSSQAENAHKWVLLIG